MSEPSPTVPADSGPAMFRLLETVQQLSLARDLPTVMAIVRAAARELTGADGAAFVLRDGDQCHYADEDAIAPLWKGMRFPMSACISGWAMIHRETVAVADVHADPRIPAGAYRATFVKSLAMVPIRRADPVGAIGTYWAQPHAPSADEIRLLEALADSTSIAIDNVQTYAGLEHAVAERTAQLQHVNRELETFSYSISHDLRAPLRAIDGFTRLVIQKHAAGIDEKGRDYLDRVVESAARMQHLIEDLLTLSRISRKELRRERVDLTDATRAILDRLRVQEPARRVDTVIAPGCVANADAGLSRVVLENLLGNAWKYTSKRETAKIEFGEETLGDGTRLFFVRDDGAGFDPDYAGKLFAAFQRLHAPEEFPGNGIGLATVQRIVNRHAGRVWAEGAIDRGATFRFTLES